MFYLELLVFFALIALLIWQCIGYSRRGQFKPTGTARIVDGKWRVK